VGSTCLIYSCCTPVSHESDPQASLNPRES